MKADLKKYKDYTILFNAHETDSGLFCPVVTIFKSGEKAITLDIKRPFIKRDQALCFALGVGETTVDAKLEGKKPDFALLVSGHWNSGLTSWPVK